MSESIFCIYHARCVDGTTAASVVLKAHPHAICIPLKHGLSEAEYRDALRDIPIGATVFIVDTTRGVEICLEKKCSVTIIDHHQGVFEYITSLAHENKNVTYVFDNNKSGASLAWNYFFRDLAIPKLITYVEDEDLWKHQYQETKFVNVYLSLLRDTPEQILALIDENIQSILDKGEIITMYTDHAIAQDIQKEANVLALGSYTLPVFNITDHQSHCGNILSKRHDCAVALYTINGNSVQLSFRSLDNHTPSAHTLAQFLGGGGHQNASGATMALTAFFEAL